MTSDHHSYDAIMQAAPIQQQHERQAFINAAAMAQKYGVELGTELTDEIAAPTTYYPREEPNGNPGFYENDLWMNVKPQRQAKPVDTRTQQEVEFENLLVEQHQAEQPREQAEQVQGQNAQIVYSRLEHGWNDPAFDAYLASDDDAYQQVQLSPQLLQWAEQQFGVDEDTARAYAYHHRLDANDLTLIERSFLGQSSGMMHGYKISAPPKQEPKSKTVDDDDNLDADDIGYATDSSTAGDTGSVGGYDSVAALNDVNHIRRTYFPQTNDAAWSNVLNSVLDEFESLPMEDREAYDSAAGIWALYQRVSYRKQQRQAKQQKQSLQTPPAASKKQFDEPSASRLNNAALTRDGRLRQSWIDRLSPDDYAKNADRIFRWYRANKIALDA